MGLTLWLEKPIPSPLEQNIAKQNKVHQSLDYPTKNLLDHQEKAKPYDWKSPFLAHKNTTPQSQVSHG